MRFRIANPHQDAHGVSMRCYDFFAAPGLTPAALPALIETAVPGLKLENRAGSQNGALFTSRRPDGLLYVSIVLYDHACADPNCLGGHRNVVIEAAPVLTSAQETALALAYEHPQILIIKAVMAMLLQTGFTTRDAPLAGEEPL